MWLKVVIETFFGLGLFVNALLFIPQIMKIYRAKKSEELSVITFGGFCLIQIFTILHGVIHDDRILIIGNILSFLTCGTLTVLILAYKK